MSFAICLRFYIGDSCYDLAYDLTEVACRISVYHLGTTAKKNSFDVRCSNRIWRTETAESRVTAANRNTTPIVSFFFVCDCNCMLYTVISEFGQLSRLSNKILTIASRTGKNSVNKKNSWIRIVIPSISNGSLLVIHLTSQKNFTRILRQLPT